MVLMEGERQAMCYASMNSRKCPQDKECRNGYHVCGTNKCVVEKTPVTNQNGFSLKAGSWGAAFPPIGAPAGPVNILAGIQGKNGQMARCPSTRTGNQTGIFPQAGSSATTSVFDVGQVVRQEILQVLKELKATQTPPEPKKLAREELLGVLKALGL